MKVSCLNSIPIFKVKIKTKLMKKKILLIYLVIFKKEKGYK